MLKNIRDFFKPPVFEEDSEKTRRAGILHYGSIVLFAALLMLFLINLTVGPQGATSTSWLLLLVALLQILIQWMIRPGYVNAASFILLTIGWGAITGISRTVDGIHDEAIFGYVLVILGSGYLLGWRASTGYTLASIASMWFLAYLEKNGSIAADIDTPYLTALYLTIIFILIFLIVYFLVQTLMQALEQADRELSERKRIELERESMIVELEKRNAESESLRETTVIVTSTLDVSEAAHRILQQLKRVMAYDSASVWLYEGTTTHLMGGDGIPDIPEEDKHYTIGENEPDYPLWTQGLPYILLDDVQEDYPQFREPPINYIRGWLGVPLKAHGELIGIISLDSRKVGYFTHADAQLALNFANQVSIAVENARLFSDLEDKLVQRQGLIDELDSTNLTLEREIEERKRIQDKLQKLARTDSLTGLFNRRYFFEIAEKEFSESIRYDRPLSVIILDLDLFKEINDTYGHLVGDQALIHIGKLLRKAIRTPDTAARYGGEEFVVLLPETGSAKAMIFAERLRKLVEDSPVQNGNASISLTASFGVAGYQTKGEEKFDQLISKADQALYMAKGNGRNRVVCYREDTTNPMP